MRDDVMGALGRLDTLCAELDEQIRALEGALPVLTCRQGCAQCCVDDVTVFEVEAERIRRARPEVLAQGAGPVGACPLLDDHGSCRVYEQRPYVCRTQGLPLRWLDDQGGETVERRDICELNDERLSLLELDPEQCWTLGEFEGRLATIQHVLDGGELRRIALRALFGRPSGSR